MEDSLEDLPQEEAQELRDFLDKRRWFESKLKIPLHLSIDDVTQWQIERDRTEEEVLDFDGGDLERIKKKTRDQRGDRRAHNAQRETLGEAGNASPPSRPGQDKGGLGRPTQRSRGQGVMVRTAGGSMANTIRKGAPATSEYHQDLQRLIRQLPKAAYNPLSHPAYPEKDKQHAEILVALHASQAQAQDSLNHCQILIQWYGKLVEARQSILNRQKDLSTCSHLLQEINNVETIEDMVWIQRADEGATLTHQMDLAIFKYRNTCRQYPEVQIEDDLIDQAERSSQNLLDLSETARRNIQVLPLVQRIIRAIDKVEIDFTALETSIQFKAHQISWPGMCSDIAPITERVSNVLEKTLALTNDMTRLRETRKLPKLLDSLETKMAKVTNQQAQLKQSSDLLIRVHKQTQAVECVEAQVIKLQQKINTVHFDATTLQALEREHADWTSTLANRIPFLDNNTSLSPSLTSPKPSILKVATVDQAVRDHVNKRSMELASKVAQCRIAYHHAEKCHLATALWQPVYHNIMAEINKLDMSNLPSKAAVLAIDDLFHKLKPVLFHHRHEAIDALEQYAKHTNPAEDASETALQTARLAVNGALSEMDHIEITLDSLRAAAKLVDADDVFGPLPLDPTTPPARPPVVALPTIAGAMDDLRIPVTPSKLPRLAHRTASNPISTPRNPSPVVTQTTLRNRAVSETPSRIPSLQSLSTSQSRPTLTQYVADPKSKLDIAVGEIINKLDVST
ncbi:uncharacterized protein IL334_003473 [Kwoniella shivajii]|uniref:Uncharacterized protein n=1 Tax=Kwoniella shivajii TaxID=564305 RepID=A0ABZ1CZE8_9TREE|nr:hypothetical protein IL334_003473 [Kwoniella shivajii]